MAAAAHCTLPNTALITSQKSLFLSSMAAATRCTLPKTALITSQKSPFLTPKNQSPFPLSILKFHRPNLPTLSVSTTDAPGVAKSGDELPDRWREIMGENNWKGLLDPMDPLLRVELLKYAEFAECTYNAFIDDRYARNYGVGKFEKWEYFDEILMPKQGYDVTQYIYCTSHNEWWPPLIPKPINPRTWQQSNIWMGFIAVSNDETSKKLGRRDICVTWRGTSTTIEWENNVLANLVPLPDDKEFLPNPDPRVKVSNGFLSLYTHNDGLDSSSRRIVLKEVERLVNLVYPDDELSITVTGHSLGGALALLNAYDIVETRMNIRRSGGTVPVTAITYAEPRLGNPKFKERTEKLGLKVLRVVNVHDLVPTVPGVVLNEGWPDWMLKIVDWMNYPFVYTHVGVVLNLDPADSPYLKPPSVFSAHDMEGHMHLIDGYQGTGKKFELTTKRDIALVNKTADLLKDDYLVPPQWKVDLNKSMVRNTNGQWVHRSMINYFPN